MLQKTVAAQWSEETTEEHNRMAIEDKQVPINRLGNGISQPLHLTNAHDVDNSNSNQLDMQSTPDNSIKTCSGDGGSNCRRSARRIIAQ